MIVPMVNVALAQLDQTMIAKSRVQIRSDVARARRLRVAPIVSALVALATCLLAGVAR